MLLTGGLLNKHGSQIGASSGSSASSLGATFWMEPTSGDVTALALGDATNASIQGTPTHVVGEEYHAGTVDRVSFGSGRAIHYPDMTGAGFTDLTTPWWVAGTIKVTNAPSFEGLCANGANTGTQAGFRVRYNNGGFYVEICDGTTRRAQGLPGTITPALGDTLSFLLEFMPDVANDKVTVRQTVSGQGIYATGQAQREFTGLTNLASAVPFYSGLIVGANTPTGGSPFDGEASIAMGELPNGEYFPAETMWDLHNHNRFRLYSEVSSSAPRDFVKIPLIGPKKEGIAFAIRSDVSLKANVYDKATYTLQGSSALIASVDGFVRGEVTGLTAGQEIQVEFENAAGNIASMEWHHRVMPDNADDCKIGVMSCAKLHDDADDPMLNNTTMTFITSGPNSRPDFVMTSEWGYFDPDTNFGLTATIADMVTQFDTSFLGDKSYLFHCNNAFLTQGDDHAFENDGDSTSDYIDLGVEFIRLMNPVSTSDYRHVTEGWDYSLELGPFRVIYLDTRSGKVDSVNMMSTPMINWFEAEITAAKNAGQVPIIHWGNILKYAPDSPLSGEFWDTYAAERTARFNHISSVFGTTGKPFISVSSDIHTNGLASESQSKFDTAGLLKAPSICVGPVNHSFRELKGDWDHYNVAGNNRFGIIDITNNASDLTCDFSIWSSSIQGGTTMSETITKPS